MMSEISKACGSEANGDFIHYAKAQKRGAQGTTSWMQTGVQWKKRDGS
jgi:hypothetical protein